MKNLSFLNLFFLCLLVCINPAGAQETDIDPSKQWPSYRGFNAGGALDGADLPETWDVKTGENILWKKTISGLGLSSPVIW